MAARQCAANSLKQRQPRRCAARCCAKRQGSNAGRPCISSPMKATRLHQETSMPYAVAPQEIH
eukprot:1447339-Prorocentrum_lima.AAC.1